jgi:hypothetical protein
LKIQNQKSEGGGNPDAKIQEKTGNLYKFAYANKAKLRYFRTGIQKIQILAENTVFLGLLGPYGMGRVNPLQVHL